MRSVLRSVRKRKKSRRLGEVDIISREEYAGFDVDAKVEMIRALVPLGLMHVQELLDDEVTELAGARHARKESLVRGRRYGSNPGTVRLAGQRVPIRVPRVRSVAGGEIPLRSYEAAREDGQVNDVLLKRVLYGISCRVPDGGVFARTLNLEVEQLALAGRAFYFGAAPRTTHGRTRPPGVADSRACAGHWCHPWRCGRLCGAGSRGVAAAAGWHAVCRAVGVALGWGARSCLETLVGGSWAAPWAGGVRRPPPPGPSAGSDAGRPAHPYAVPRRTRRRGAAGPTAWGRRRAGAAAAGCAR